MSMFSWITNAVRGRSGHAAPTGTSEPEAESPDALLALVREGNPAEQEAALAKLGERAEASGGREDCDALARALFDMRRFDEAITIWRQLIENFPDADVMRLSLATAFSQVGQISLCRHHLGYLAERGGSEELRGIGRDQLAGYERFLGLTEADAELRDLQLAALHEAIAADACPPDEYRTYAKLLRRAHTLEPGGGWLEQSRKVLEAGSLRHPDDVAILELLVAAYLANDPDGRLDKASRRLERLAPNSRVFEVMASVTSTEEARWHSDMTTRMGDLLHRAGAADPSQQAAALSDLRRIVEEYPQNPQYRMTYAFALLVKGDQEEASRQALILDEVDDDSHAFHFNLGQIFYGVGDSVRGRAHLDLALVHAADDGERQDVWERIAELERR